jgi:hypothetical protein
VNTVAFLFACGCVVSTLGSPNYDGSINWAAMDNSTSSPIDNNSTSNMFCAPSNQGVYTASKQNTVIHSAGFPNRQIAGTQCTWTYKAPSDQCVRLQMTKCDVEDGQLMVSVIDRVQATLISRNNVSCADRSSKLRFETAQHENELTIYYTAVDGNGTFNGTGFAGMVVSVECTDAATNEAGFKFPMWGYYVVGGTGALVLALITVYISYMCCCKKKNQVQPDVRKVDVAIPVMEAGTTTTVAVEQFQSAPSAPAYVGPAAYPTLPSAHHNHTSHYHAQSQPTVIHYNGAGAPQAPAWRQN